MRATVNRDALLRALAPVVKVADPAGLKACMPVCGCAVLDVRGDELHLRATDLHRTVQTRASADGCEAGAVAVPAKLLSEILRSLPPGVAVEVRDEVLLRPPQAEDESDGPAQGPIWERHTGYALLRASWVRPNGPASRCEFKVLGVADLAEHVPAVPAAPETWHTVSAAPLRALLADCLPFVSTDDTRQSYAHLHLRGEGETWRGAACDGHRLRRAAAPAPFPIVHLAIPRASVPALVDALDKVATCEVAASEKHLHLRTDGAVLSVALSQVPPLVETERRELTGDATRASRCAVDRKLLDRELRAFRRSIGGTGGKRSSTPVILGWGGRALRLTRRDEQTGTFTREVPARCTGPATGIALNIRYLADALATATGTEVEIGADGALDPCTVAGAVLMPMRYGLEPEDVPRDALEAAGEPSETPAPEPLPVVESPPVVEAAKPIETPEPVRVPAQEAARNPDDIQLGHREPQACGNFARIRVYAANGDETPLFIDQAKRTIGETHGHRFGVFHAGASDSGCAAVVGACDKIAEAIEIARTRWASIRACRERPEACPMCGGKRWRTVHLGVCLVDERRQACAMCNHDGAVPDVPQAPKVKLPPGVAFVGPGLAAVFPGLAAHPATVVTDAEGVADPLDVLRAAEVVQPQAPPAETPAEPPPSRAICLPAPRPALEYGASWDQADGEYRIVLDAAGRETGLFVRTLPSGTCEVWHEGAAPNGGALAVGPAETPTAALDLAAVHLRAVVPIDRARRRCELTIPEGEIWTPCSRPPDVRRAGHPFERDGEVISYYTDKLHRRDWAQVTRDGTERWYDVTLAQEHRRA